MGRRNPKPLNNWAAIEGVKLVGFCDTDDENAKIVAEKYALPRFATTNELLDACDAVDIVAPTTFHFELCEAAIKKGKHVFVEKPLANTMDEARALVKLAKEANIKFQVGHVERFNPAFLALKNMALQPMFIEVHRLAQFKPRGTDVSVILDLMIHDIDIILHLVKAEMLKIANLTFIRTRFSCLSQNYNNKVSKLKLKPPNTVDPSLL